MSAPTERDVEVAAPEPEASTEAKKPEEDTGSAVTQSTSAATPEEIQKASVTRASFNAPARWMVAFGVLLTICAGCVDVVTFRGLGIFVTHMTGTSAKVGMRIEGIALNNNTLWDLSHSVILVLSFVFGSFLCGLVIPKNQVHFGGKSFYGVALIANAVLLVAAGLVAPTSGMDPFKVHASAYLAAMASGLQNAMCSMHFGAIVRTTHVTGTITDIGSTAGRAVMILLRRGCRPSRLNIMDEAELEVDRKKLQVLLPIYFGFVGGCVLGAILHSAMGNYALFVPAAVTFSAGTVYTFFRAALKKRLKKMEEQRLQAEISEVEDALERAANFLHMDGSHPRMTGSGGRHFGMDDHLEHALEVAHDVESTINELYAESSSRAPESWGFRI